MPAGRPCPYLSARPSAAAGVAWRGHRRWHCCHGPPRWSPLASLLTSIPQYLRGKRPWGMQWGWPGPLATTSWAATAESAWVAAGVDRRDWLADLLGSGRWGTPGQRPSPLPTSLRAAAVSPVPRRYPRRSRHAGGDIRGIVGMGDPLAAAQPAAAFFMGRHRAVRLSSLPVSIPTPHSGSPRVSGRRRTPGAAAHRRKPRWMTISTAARSSPARRPGQLLEPADTGWPPQRLHDVDLCKHGRTSREDNL